MGVGDRNANTDGRQRRAIGRMVRSGAAHIHVGNETPGGTLDGTNKIFTLAQAPMPSSLQLFKNGLLMSAGASDDYTLSGSAITFADDQMPQSSDKMRAFYIVGA